MEGRLPSLTRPGRVLSAIAMLRQLPMKALPLGLTWIAVWEKILRLEFSPYAAQTNSPFLKSQWRLFYGSGVQRPVAARPSFACRFNLPRRTVVESDRRAGGTVNLR